MIFAYSWVQPVCTNQLEQVEGEQEISPHPDPLPKERENSRPRTGVCACRSYGAWVSLRRLSSIDMALLTELFAPRPLATSAREMIARGELSFRI
jgi:hypothetical protein